MRMFNYLFNNKEERAKEKCVNDVLKRTDDFIERTEKMLMRCKRTIEGGVVSYECIRFL